MSRERARGIFQQLENIELRTSNEMQPGDCFLTGCWMLVVRCWMFLACKNNKSLPGLSVEQGQMGDGSVPSSLSHADIRRAPFGGCQLPDAILHGKRSFRPRSRAVQCLAAAGFRVRLFSLLGPMVAPPLQTRSRHACDFLSRLDH